MAFKSSKEQVGRAFFGYSNFLPIAKMVISTKVPLHCLYYVKKTYMGH
jgi:hypothetical protein